jgi:predicted nucleic acid-binding protein
VILADTSIWIDHLRGGDRRLSALLEEGGILGHPFVLGELALGGLRGRDVVIDSLEGLPQAQVASHDEVMSMIASRRLWGRGIGLIDAHLLAATALTPEAKLWTRDRGLDAVARELGLAADASA